jgi:hypothetical protein
MALHPQYIIDSTGKKKSVVLPVKEYAELLELAQDVIDHALIEEVRNDERVPWAEVKSRLSRRVKK